MLSSSLPSADFPSTSSGDHILAGFSEQVRRSLQKLDERMDRPGAGVSRSSFLAIKSDLESMQESFSSVSEASSNNTLIDVSIDQDPRDSDFLLIQVRAPLSSFGSDGPPSAKSILQIKTPRQGSTVPQAQFVPKAVNSLTEAWKPSDDESGAPPRGKLVPALPPKQSSYERVSVAKTLRRRSQSTRHTSESPYSEYHRVSEISDQRITLPNNQPPSQGRKTRPENQWQTPTNPLGNSNQGPPAIPRKEWNSRINVRDKAPNRFESLSDDSGTSLAKQSLLPETYQVASPRDQSPAANLRKSYLGGMSWSAGKLEASDRPPFYRSSITDVALDVDPVQENTDVSYTYDDPPNVPSKPSLVAEYYNVYDFQREGEEIEAPHPVFAEAASPVIPMATGGDRELLILDRLLANFNPDESGVFPHSNLPTYRLIKELYGTDVPSKYRHMFPTGEISHRPPRDDLDLVGNTESLIAQLHGQSKDRQMFPTGDVSHRPPGDDRPWNTDSLIAQLRGQSKAVPEEDPPPIQSPTTELPLQSAAGLVDILENSWKNGKALPDDAPQRTLSQSADDLIAFIEEAEPKQSVLKVTSGDQLHTRKSSSTKPNAPWAFSNEASGGETFLKELDTTIGPPDTPENLPYEVREASTASHLVELLSRSLKTEEINRDSSILWAQSGGSADPAQYIFDASSAAGVGEPRPPGEGLTHVESRAAEEIETEPDLKTFSDNHETWALTISDGGSGPSTPDMDVAGIATLALDSLTSPKRSKSSKSSKRSKSIKSSKRSKSSKSSKRSKSSKSSKRSKSSKSSKRSKSSSKPKTGQDFTPPILSSSVNSSESSTIPSIVIPLESVPKPQSKFWLGKRSLLSNSNSSGSKPTSAGSFSQRSPNAQSNYSISNSSLPLHFPEPPSQTAYELRHGFASQNNPSPVAPGIFSLPGVSNGDKTSSMRSKPLNYKQSVSQFLSSRLNSMYSFVPKSSESTGPVRFGKTSCPAKSRVLSGPSMFPLLNDIPHPNMKYDLPISKSYQVGGSPLPKSYQAGGSALPSSYVPDVRTLVNVSSKSSVQQAVPSFYNPANLSARPFLPGREYSGAFYQSGYVPSVTVSLPIGTGQGWYSGKPSRLRDNYSVSFTPGPFMGPTLSHSPFQTRPNYGGGTYSPGVQSYRPVANRSPIYQPWTPPNNVLPMKYNPYGPVAYNGGGRRQPRSNRRPRQRMGPFRRRMRGLGSPFRQLACIR